MLGVVAVLLAAIALGDPPEDRARSATAASLGASTEPIILATNPSVQASLGRIAAQSALWRDAILSLRSTGRRVQVVTPDQVLVAGSGGKLAAFDRSVLAEAVPVIADGSQVDRVVVVINVELLERLHWNSGSVPSELYSDIDSILIHEIYGHAVPYLIAGDTSGRCADPAAGERASDACAIRRENAVRAELGLSRRTDYGLEGLNLTRRTSRY
jgi:hypothetical protein